MKIKGLNKYKLIWLIIAFVLIIGFVAIAIISRSKVKSMKDQQMGLRWSEDGGYAQVSAFFSQQAGVTPDSIKSFEYSLTENLKQESIVVDNETYPTARLFASCYAAEGNLSVSSAQATTSLVAYGVGGDFFMFHELELVTGGYFSESDLNNDFVILDETAAWKLYGSNDVAGMTLYVGDRPLVVRGVVSLPDSKTATKAGVASGCCFVSYSYLTEVSSCGSISSYEIVMPNPVKGYALKKVTDLIGTGTNTTELVDNTVRFSLSNRISLIGSFGYRAMSTKAIAYPWWENIVRSDENVIALLTLGELFLLSCGVIILIALLIVLIVQNKEFRELSKAKIKRRIRLAYEFIISKMYKSVDDR